MDDLHHIHRQQLVPAPLETVFAFFSSAENLEALTPPFLRFRIATPLPIKMEAGTRIEYTIRLGGVPMKWRTHIAEWAAGERFVDEQESGPFAIWRHTHTFEPRGAETLMRDHVAYREPFGPLGKLAHRLFVRRTVERIFDFRRAQVSLCLGAAAPADGGATQGRNAV